MSTPCAAAHLRRLRDLNLLEQKGRGNTTFYTPTSRLLTPGISSSAPGIRGIPKNFPALPKELLESLQKVGERTSIEKIRKMIIELCAIRPLRLLELVEILQRDSDHLRKRYLSKMIDEKELEYQFPESPNHPLQAYKATKSLKD